MLRADGARSKLTRQCVRCGAARSRYRAVGGALPALVEIAGGDPQRVLTVSDFAAAARLGTRSSGTEDTTLRYDVLGNFARLAADGWFTVPVARTFVLEDWRTALDVRLSGRARDKLVLLPRRGTGSNEPRVR